MDWNTRSKRLAGEILNLFEAEEAIPAEGYIPDFLEGMALYLKGERPPDENVQPTAKNSGWYGVRDCRS